MTECIESLPMCASISKIFSMLDGSISTDVTLFSTAKTTPSDVQIPTAVDPSCIQQHRKLKQAEILTVSVSLLITPKESGTP